MPNEKKPGCGRVPATKIIFRGPVKRLYLCGSCEYEGSGRVAPYETADPNAERKPGVFSGPARRCGEETL